MKKHGFTLLELMVVVTCFLLVLGPAYQIFVSGTRQYTSGVLQIETTLEARRIIRQLHNDLKMATFATGDGGYTLRLHDMLEVEGIYPTLQYSFLSFPAKTESEAIMPPADQPYRHRFASRITYSLQPPTGPGKTGFRLVRKEEFPALLGRQPWVKVLSERVNNFHISPVSLPEAAPEQIRTGAPKPQWFFFVTLQLVDSIRPQQHPAGAVPVAARSQGLVVADFTDLVCPEFFCAFHNQEGVGRNWHNGIIGPD